MNFAVLVVLLLPPCFVAWWLLGELLLAPAYIVGDFLLRHWLPGAVAQSQLDGSMVLVITEFADVAGAIVEKGPTDDALGLRVNARVLSYAIPFYAALHFATPMTASWERFARALLVLWLLLALGLVATVMKDLMLTVGAPFIEQPGVPPADAIALAYQFFTLIVPPLAPVLLWAYGARDVPAFRELLPPSLQAPPDEDAASRSSSE